MQIWHYNAQNSVSQCWRPQGIKEWEHRDARGISSRTTSWPWTEKGPGHDIIIWPTLLKPFVSLGYWFYLRDELGSLDNSFHPFLIFDSSLYFCTTNMVLSMEAMFGLDIVMDYLWTLLWILNINSINYTLACSFLMLLNVWSPFD